MSTTLIGEPQPKANGKATHAERHLVGDTVAPPIPDWRHPQAVFDYKDAHGNLLYQNVRFLLVTPDGSPVMSSNGQAAILQEIEADQKPAAEAAAEDEACEADRVKWEAAQQAEEAEAERERTEVEAILDGGPDTDLPPASEPVVASSETFHVATLERTIEARRSIMTKPLSTFGSAKISPNDIEQVTAFLQKVAKQIAEERRAA